METTYAVIVAAGTGTRFGSAVPKQFLPLGNDGRPVLMHTVDAFINAGVERRNIRLVLNAKAFAYWHDLCGRFGYESPAVVKGGRTRFNSVKNALRNIRGPKDSTVLVHDGARPLVTAALIRRVIETVRTSESAIPVVPVTDSLRELRDDGTSAIVSRSRYRAVQTPQGFTASMLRAAYAVPFREEFTDDASVVEYAGYTVNLVDGDPENIKITTPVDLALASIILDSRK